MGVLVSRPGDLFIGYEYHETVATGVESEAVYIIPFSGGGGKVTVTLRAGANTGKIQYTTVDSADVIADTVASGDWSDWSTYEDDNLSTDTLLESIVSPITGIRCVSLVGEVKFDIII